MQTMRVVVFDDGGDGFEFMRTTFRRVTGWDVSITGAAPSLSAQIILDSLKSLGNDYYDAWYESVLAPACVTLRLLCLRSTRCLAHTHAQADCGSGHCGLERCGRR